MVNYDTMVSFLDQAFRENLAYSGSTASSAAPMSGRTIQECMGTFAKKDKWNKEMRRFKDAYESGNIAQFAVLGGNGKGGVRDGCGRKRKNMRGETGLEMTKTDSALRAKEEHRRREQQDQIDYTESEKNIKKYVTKPYKMPLEGMIDPDNLIELGIVAEAVFKRPVDKEADNTTLVTDLAHSGATGQKRVIAFPTKVQRRIEKLRLKGPHINHIVLQETFWAQREKQKMVLKTFVSNIAEKLRAENIDGAEPGYPKADQAEVEFGETPTGTRHQDPHMDGCWHAKNVLVPLQTGASETHVKSTWVAKPDSDWGQMAVAPIEYHQFELNCNLGASTEALCFHMAWPHYGPGNMGSQPRSAQIYSIHTKTQ
jgi:hypothetical protein